MPDSHFYLGRWKDDSPKGEKQPVHYDPADLTTHAVMIGMTGSGKTGLLIALLEEAARQGIPAIIIDPKGDLTNLLLHFPELRPEDFAPWIDPEAARRAGTGIDDLAAATAERWRKGLADWDLSPVELAALRDQVDYTVYTPGSTAGEPVNLLASFDAPADWDLNREGQRERIASIVTALLGLVGMGDVDPLRSREHILLANILESAWSRGQSLDLSGLIEQVTAPPFDKLGAFPLERFFPQKDRFELALLLNNFLAAPSFQTWLEGQPLDMTRLLQIPQPGTTQGAKPHFSIYYLAHLSESERMFFVTLLLASVESWMRSQRGTSGLRALVAFDEITGYLPPVANPPSRPVLLRLLKQGRAFGVGLALATQNPTDLNYKALSNAGTWFIGRLQTEQDKQRLLDGLQSLESGIERQEFDQMISRLAPRLFLLHNVHAGGPRIFQTRWALNYLAGPLTRAQIPSLPSHPAAASLDNNGKLPSILPPPQPPTWTENRSEINFETPSLSSPPLRVPTAGLSPSTPRDPSSSSSPSSSPLRASASPRDLSSPPSPPPVVPAFFIPAGLSLQRALARGGALRGPLEPDGLIYKPALLAQAETRCQNRRYNLDTTRKFACLLPGLDLSRPDWEAFTRPPFDPAWLGDSPLPEGRFLPLPEGWNTSRVFTNTQKDFLDWVYRSAAVTVRANEALKVYAGPDLSYEAFRRQLESAANEGMQAEAEKVAAGFDQKLEVLARKIEKQQLIVDRRQDAVSQRKAEQTSTDFELFASVFTRRKRSLTTSITKRRMTSQAQSELDEARKILENQRDEWKDLAAGRKEALQRIQAAWQERAAQVTNITISPLKKDVLLDYFGIAWLPYYRLKNPDGVVDLPGF